MTHSCVTVIATDNIVKYATKLTEASVLQFSENYRIFWFFMYNGICIHEIFPTLTN